jgi:hypothetical protein
MITNLFINGRHVFTLKKCLLIKLINDLLENVIQLNIEPILISVCDKTFE